MSKALEIEDIYSWAGHWLYDWELGRFYLRNPDFKAVSLTFCLCNLASRSGTFAIKDSQEAERSCGHLHPPSLVWCSAIRGILFVLLGFSGVLLVRYTLLVFVPFCTVAS